MSSDSKPESVKALPTYEMQCVDCHNRPTHSFDLPDGALDKALAGGDIAVTLPYIKKKGVELLKVNYATRQEAADKLPRTLISFYQEHYPELYAQRTQDIAQTGQAVLAICDRNVFPELKVTWVLHANNATFSLEWAF